MEDLEAQYLLSGSVFLDAACLRTNAKLLNASDRRVVWAESYAGPHDESLGKQDEIASQITESVLRSFQLYGPGMRKVS